MFTLKFIYFIFTFSFFKQTLLNYEINHFFFVFKKQNQCLHLSFIIHINRMLFRYVLYEKSGTRCNVYFECFFLFYKIVRIILLFSFSFVLFLCSICPIIIIGFNFLSSNFFLCLFVSMFLCFKCQQRTTTIIIIVYRHRMLYTIFKNFHR